MFGWVPYSTASWCLLMTSGDSGFIWFIDHLFACLLVCLLAIGRNMSGGWRSCHGGAVWVRRDGETRQDTSLVSGHLSGCAHIMSINDAAGGALLLSPYPTRVCSVTNPWKGWRQVWETQSKQAAGSSSGNIWLINQMINWWLWLLLNIWELD